MKKKVILYRDISAQERQRLDNQFDITFFNGINEENKDAFIAALADVEGLIGTSTNMSSDLLSLAPKLKAASTISVGTDLYDLNHLTERGIPLMHTPGVLNETTADTLFTLIMCTARRAVELSNMVREGRWISNIGEALYGTDVHGKTLGIIGMGRIGYAIAKRGHFGFDMKIQYSNRSRNLDAEKDLNATYMDIESLLKTSDFVCVMTPLTPQTERLIGAKEFAMMKESAIFINGSRGKGLDVFEVEPLPASSSLCKLENVVLFPHIGSATTETRLKMVSCAVDNLINALNGDTSQNCANQHLLSR
jgi:gluconate 2-dehydrogenase